MLIVLMSCYDSEVNRTLSVYLIYELFRSYGGLPILRDR